MYDNLTRGFHFPRKGLKDGCMERNWQQTWGQWWVSLYGTFDDKCLIRGSIELIDMVGLI